MILESTYSLIACIRCVRVELRLISQKFIEGIDANDNGISAFPSDIKPKFESALSITGMIAALNPAWNEPAIDTDVDKRFEEASILIGEQFLKKLDFYGKAWLPARDIVIDALEQSQNLDPNGRILHLPRFCPWKVFNSGTADLTFRNIFSIWRKNEALLAGSYTSYSQTTLLQHTESRPCHSQPTALRTENLCQLTGVVFETMNCPQNLEYLVVSLSTQLALSVEIKHSKEHCRWPRKHWGYSDR